MKVTEEIMNLLMTGCAVEETGITRGSGIDARERKLLDAFLATLYIYPNTEGDGWEYRCPGSFRRLTTILNGLADSAASAMHPEVRFYLADLHRQLRELYDTQPSGADQADWLCEFEEGLSRELDLPSTVYELEIELGGGRDEDDEDECDCESSEDCDNSCDR